MRYVFFFCNLNVDNYFVVVELCASNEELCSKFVEETIGCRITKKKPTKDEVRAMRVKVLQLMRKFEEQELLITSMEKEVNDIVELIARRNCLRRYTQSEVVEVEPLAMDCTYLKKAESSHEDVDEVEPKNSTVMKMYMKINNYM